MIYDITTKNISFLKMSKALREKGIENNKFMLTLYDEGLQGIDPHDENLPLDIKLRIYTEICNNVWYFVREVARVSNGTPTGCPFRLIKGTLAQIYIITFDLNYILLLPRQVGKTIAEIIYSLWSTMFASYASDTLYFNKDAAQAKANLATYKKHRELLPKWLRELVQSKDDVDNTERIRYAKNKNTITIKGSATSPDNADKLGRGCTVPNIYMDEFAFLTYNDIVYRAAYPAWKTASENAKLNGSPTGIHITTTPNNLDENTPGAYMYSMIQDSCDFIYEMYDMNKEELTNFIHNNSSNDFVHIEYGYKDCGKDDNWLEECKRGMGLGAGGDKTKQRIFDREYLLKWTESSDMSVFQEEELEKIKSFTRDHVWMLNINGYNIKFYERPDFKLNYILSCDTSNGMSLDNSVLLFIHPVDFHVVALFKHHRIDTAEFRRLIEMIMTIYFRNSVLNMESNMSGQAILEELIRNPSIEQRVYQEMRTKKVEKVINSSGERVHQTIKRIEYGSQTTTKTRELMFEILNDIVTNEPEKIISPDFYSEIKTLQYHKGKIQAMNMMHDDIVMAYLITRYALIYEKCFRTRFKIKPNAGIINANNTIDDNDNDYLAYSDLVDMANNSDNYKNNNYGNDVNQYVSESSTEEHANIDFNMDWLYQ